MPSCKEVVRLVASDELAGLPLLNRVRIRLHFWYCGHCRRYARELRAIAAAARRLGIGEPVDPERLARLERSVLVALQAK